MVAAVLVVSATGAGAQGPTEWSEMPLLADDTFIMVGDTGGGLEGPPGCWGDVHVSFIAAESVTPVWINDTDEVSFSLITSEAEFPTIDDLECGPPIWIDFDEGVFAPGNLEDGFFGELATEPGVRYWLAVTEDDGPEPFMINPGPNPGERVVLWELPEATDNTVITLPGSAEYPVTAGEFPCGGPIRFSFVATGDRSTLSFLNPETEVRLFRSDQQHPAPADLVVAECGGDSIRDGDLVIDPFETVPGERYWVAVRGEAYRDDVSLVVNGSGGSPLSDRLYLVEATPLEGFTYMLPAVEGPSDPIGDCGVVQARFTAWRTDTTLWASSDIGTFAVYEAPVDPSDPDYDRLFQTLGCTEYWSPPSAIGSVTSSFPTVPGQDYWIAWNATENVVVYQDPGFLVDEYFTNPIRFGGQRITNYTLSPFCWGSEGAVRLPFQNWGPDPASITVEFLGREISQELPAEGSLYQTMLIDGLPFGPVTFRVLSSGTLLGELVTEIDCEAFDPNRWNAIPILEEAVFRTVADVVPGGVPGIDLLGGSLVADCFGLVNVRFVATGAETQIWMDDTDEVGMAVITAGNATPDLDNLDCSGPIYLDQSPGGFDPAGPGDDGYYGTIDTVPGQTYWLSFFADDGPARIALVPGPEPDAGLYGLFIDGVSIVDHTPFVECVGGGAEILLPLENRGLVADQLRIEVDGVLSDVVYLTPGSVFDPARPVTGLTNGSRVVEVIRGGTGNVAAAWTLEVDCQGQLPSTEVGVLTSCVGGFVRVDVVIENLLDDAATYVVEFSHADLDGNPGASRFRKSSRAEALGQTRIAITGRPQFEYIDAEVYRDGEFVEIVSAYEECTEMLGDIEDVVVSTGCLAGNGLIRYAITNPSASFGVWIIEFEGLRNRSTSAPGLAIALGGISGRADGEYDMTIRQGTRVVWQGSVTVGCDA